jgi:hypothetical protein
MSLQSFRAEAVDFSSGGAFCICMDANASGWTLLEAKDHDDLLLTRFMSIPFDAMVVAQTALRTANLRGSQRVSLAVGLHARALLLSMRLPRDTATVGSVDQARAELLRFSLACRT